MRSVLPAILCLSLIPACTTSGGNTTDSDASGGTSESATETPGTTAGSNDASESGTTDDGSTSEDPSGTTGAAVLATISGVVTDMAGGMLPTVGFQACGTIDGEGNVDACVPVDVDADTGTFLFEATKVGLWSLKFVHAPLDGREFSGQAFRVELTEDEALDLSDPPVIVPEVDSLVDVSGAAGAIDVVIDSALTINLDPALAQSPDFTAPTAIGGLDAPPSTWRVTEIEGAPVVRAWAFSPFGVKATEGSFDFSFSDGLGLEASSSIKVYEIEKDNGALHEVATGTVNADATGIDLTPTGEGFHELTWLIVTQ